MALAGLENARFDVRRDRGYKKHSKLLAAKKDRIYVDKKHDDRTSKQKRLAASHLFGGGYRYPYGTSGGAALAAKVATVDRGTLHRASDNEIARAQLSKEKHLNKDWKSAAKKSKVNIGQGLYGIAGSAGTRAKVFVRGHDNEYAKEKGVSFHKSNGGKISKSFDQSKTIHAQDRKAILNPSFHY
jgi:hypothetical protein